MQLIGSGGELFINLCMNEVVCMFEITRQQIIIRIISAQLFKFQGGDNVAIYIVTMVMAFKLWHPKFVVHPEVNGDQLWVLQSKEFSDWD